MWQNSKAQNMTKLKKKSMCQNSITQNVTELKKIKMSKKSWNSKHHNYNKNSKLDKTKNSKYDKSAKLKMSKNSKNQNVTTQKLAGDKTQELKIFFVIQPTFSVTYKILWQNSRTQIDTKVNLTKLNFWQNFEKSLFSKNNLTPWQQMRCSQGSVLQSCNVWVCAA